MAYGDKTINRIMLLVKNPLENYHKIIPFIKSKFVYPKRMLFEIFGNYSLSKPYIAHEELLKNINYLENGFFVECGGNDGHFQDPTYYLEKRLGWTGIIVEPLPISKLCQKHRKKSSVYKYAVTSPDFADKVVDFIDVNAMSIISNSIKDEDGWVKTGERVQKITARKIKVNTKTIQQIIDDHFTCIPKRNIDLMVLDIEGYEINALQGLDFKENAPSFILVECHNLEKKEEIEELLIKEGYNNGIKISFIDYLFSKK